MKHDAYIVREGWVFIAIGAIITIILGLAGLVSLTIIFLAITVFIMFFFRNPSRDIPPGENSIVSPADGRVIIIEDVIEEGLIMGRFKKISIFMNIFNVHVNRMPCAGEILDVDYKAGKFIRANLDKASFLNERNYVLVKTAQGSEIMVVQIAGLIARRIVCWLKAGMEVKKGERFGLIRFGSRLDVYLPPEINIKVKLGQKVRAGETVLGGIV